MESYRRLLLNNKAWVQTKLEVNPEFFKDLSKGQSPEFLWIGCSDSRVPAEEVTGTQPGDIFVHRNIANMVIHTDLNLSSVLSYAVDHLKVKHIVVCGHYGCGGVQAAMSNADFGILNKWLRHIKDVYHQDQEEIRAIDSTDERFDRLVELNVIQQVKNLIKTDVIQRAWKNEERPILHGWVYSLKSGLLKDLVKFGPEYEMPSIYKFDM